MAQGARSVALSHEHLPMKARMFTSRVTGSPLWSKSPLRLRLLAARRRPQKWTPNALPESETLQESFRKYTSGLGIKAEGALVGLADTTMLKRLPTLEELSNVASFVASDRASALTGSIIKIDCGA